MRTISTRSFTTVAAAVLAVAAVTPVTVDAITTPSEPERGKVARVVGAADFMLPYHPDADVRHFEFDAVAAPFTRPIGGFPGLPNDAKGTVKVSHYVASIDKTITAEGQVDSMVTSPRTATLTAIITKVSPGGPDWKGKRLGFSVYDAGPDRHGRSKDRVGLSWDIVNLNVKESGEIEELAVGTSMASAPYAPVTKGGFTVTHAELPELPR